MNASGIRSQSTVKSLAPDVAFEKADTDWVASYTIAGWAATLMLATIPAAVVAYLVWPPPFGEPASEWFAVFQDNWLRGLLGLDLLFLTSNLLMAPIYLALYVALRRLDESLMAIALALGLVSLAAYFSSNTAFQMLLLSNQHEVAKTESERAAALAAGEAMLATFEGTAFNVYYVLSAVALLIIAYVMLKSSIFSRGTAYVGLVAGVFMLVPATAGILGVIFSMASLFPWMIFLVLIARKFFHLSRGAPSAKMKVTQ
jgi:hypothetical protein